MDNVFIGELLGTAIRTLVNRANLDDAERIEIAEFHTEWKQGSNYGTNEYRKWNVADNGRAVLYRTSRAITNSQTPPDVPTSPASWVKLGSAA